MARFNATGAVLGIRSKDYDLPNEDGTRNRGTSHRLLLLDQDAMVVNELSVKQEQLGYFQALTVGEVVTLPVDVFANAQRGGGATLSCTAVPPQAPESSGRRAA